MPARPPGIHPTNLPTDPKSLKRRREEKAMTPSSGSRLTSQPPTDIYINVSSQQQSVNVPAGQSVNANPHLRLPARHRRRTPPFLKMQQYHSRPTSVPPKTDQKRKRKKRKCRTGDATPYPM